MGKYIFMKRTQRGFTLIELLVVIAIIGVLASIVMVALGVSRQTANDTAVKDTTDQIRGDAELYYAANGSYGTPVTSALCPTSGTSMFYTDPQMQSLIAALNAKNGGLTKCAAGSTVSGSPTASSYSIASPVTSSTKYWCIDSNGSMKLSNDDSLFIKIMAYVVSVAHASPVGPNLGGGTPATGGGAAGCP